MSRSQCSIRVAKESWGLLSSDGRANRPPLGLCPEANVPLQVFINNLKVPEGMKVELIPVRGADSMCHGYNMGMKQTDAKYKVYIHQDTFIANKNFIGDLLNIFKDKAIGALGVIGARKLPKSGI